MSDVKWEQISFDQLADLPEAEQQKCRVRIGGVSRDVMQSDERYVRTADSEIFAAAWSWPDLAYWDAVVERPVPAHPHGRIPDEDGAVIRIHAGAQIIFELDEVWWETGGSMPIPTAAVQAFADKHGFTVLWPREGAGE